MTDKKTDCLICKRISLIEQNKNPYLIKEFETGYAVLGDSQFFKGYCLFLCKIHKEGLHELDPDFKKKFLEEMSILAEVVYKTFRPHKLNYELLGNGDRHLHWHIFPRYTDDPLPRSPIWCIDKNIRNGESSKPSEKELNTLKKQLLESFSVL